MSFFRFVSNGRGIYEAVESDCPRSDRRRLLKPDGSWLPRVGTQFPAAVSFWTENGLRKYLNSGLQEWHRSVLSHALDVVTAQSLQEVFYQDEFQVICGANQECKTVAWDVFASSLSEYRTVDKVVAYVVSDRGLLVFDHDKAWSESGTQVPAGGIDNGESLEVAVLREVEEESGLKDVRVVGKIDEYLMFRSTLGQFNRRHVFLLNSSSPVQGSWTHRVHGEGVDSGMNFHCYWLPLGQAEHKLAASLGCSVRRLEKRSKISLG